MTNYHTIKEFGKIYSQSDFPDSKDNFEAIYLNKKAFTNLWSFIVENTNDDVEAAFSLHHKKGKDYIKVKNYVGVVETKNHTIIEILPKIYLENSQEEEQESRRIFLQMLRYLRNSPFKSIDNALLKATSFPVLEIFITTFLEELDLLIKRGVQKHYVRHEENAKSLKGALNFPKNIQLNQIHKERFYVNFDEFSENIAHNRLIKSCLELLVKLSRSPKNKISIHSYLNFLDEIPKSTDINKDLIAVGNMNRLFSHYQQILSWIKVFLLNESFTNFKGKNLNKAILFPMERIFEDYVAYMFKKHGNQSEIDIQKRKYSLVEKHNGKPKFALKPDFVCFHNNSLNVFDTKWKLINENLPNKHYGISQSDMYQLFAYGEKYAKSGKQVFLHLLYPKTENFTKELPAFHYYEELSLLVQAVDLSLNGPDLVKDIEGNIGKIL